MTAKFESPHHDAPHGSDDRFPRASNGESPPIHRRLRDETSSLHRALEARLDLLEPGLSLDRYVRVLCAFYGYYIPLESCLAALNDATPAIEFPFERRAPLLERDLMVLGVAERELAGLPRCRALPQLADREQFAGCIYVLEGARLGARIISHALECRLGLTQTTGAAFFGEGEEATRTRWRGVVRWLASSSDQGAHAERIVQSACATFRTLTDWLGTRGALK